MNKFYYHICACVLLILLSGCIIAGKKGAVVTDVRSLFDGKYKVAPEIKKNMPKTIAVLPFLNPTGKEDGTEIVRRGFYNHFSSLHFHDIELYQVDHLLRKAGLMDSKTIHSKKASELAQILNVDAVVYGTISNFDKWFIGIYSQVAVGATIKMIDKKDQLLWQGEHVTRMHQGGIATTPVGLVATLLATSMNMRDIQLLRACDDLFRDMVKTIPIPSESQAAKPPTISLLAQNTKGLPQKAGNEIKVVLKGDPGLRAWMNIGAFKKGIDMQEVEPGGYVGTYTVVPGDKVENAIVVGYLSNTTGATSQWVDALGSVTIDTQPPQPPQKISALGKNNTIKITWKKNTEKDLASYRVYSSKTPLSGFSQIGETEFDYYDAQNVENQIPHFYKITAVDSAGNESLATQTIESMAIAPGPTPVKGEIKTNTTWYTGASPYIIEDKITIAQGARLTIQPGTTIISKGMGIHVLGSLISAGTPNSMILFDAEPEKKWTGLIFTQTQDAHNLIQYTRIKNAQIGIKCVSASPQILHNELSNNHIGIEISGGFSAPKLDDNIVHSNTEHGIFMHDGVSAQLSRNRIQNNLKSGITIYDCGRVNISHCQIAENQANGIVTKASQITLSKNNFLGNLPFEINGIDDSNVCANDNFWGSPKWKEIIHRIAGKITIDTVLSEAAPDGNPTPVPFLKSELPDHIDQDKVLLAAHSPFAVQKQLIIDRKATLFIQPGVVIHYHPGASIIIKEGGIMAIGTKDFPIYFTSAGSSPSPGDYLNAVRFEQKTQVASVFKFCKFEYAATALNILFGQPEISFSHITNNSQSGVKCGNDAAPRILYSTISHNNGTAGIEVRGMANPLINNNNFINNSVAVQAFSSIVMDARNNFWGQKKPDLNTIWGQNINTEPWQENQIPEAFCNRCESK